MHEAEKRNEPCVEFLRTRASLAIRKHHEKHKQKKKSTMKFLLKKSKPHTKSYEPKLAQVRATATTAEEERQEFEEACFQSQMELAIRDSKKDNPDDAVLLTVLEMSAKEAQAIEEAGKMKEEEKLNVFDDHIQPDDVFRELPAIV